MKLTILVCALMCAFVSFTHCKKSEAPNPVLRLRVKFDPLQDRLNSDGKIVDVAKGNSAQTPAINGFACSYVELTPDANTILGKGKILFDVKDTLIGTNSVRAIEYSKMNTFKDGDIILEIPLSSITPGKFTHLRLGVAAINIDVKFNLLDVPFAGDFLDERGTLNGFLNARTYLTKYKIYNKTETVNAVKQQGYWAFETKLSSGYASYDAIYNGQIFDGSTLTVVNPIRATSPTPSNSCIVTGAFDAPLTVTGVETSDINAMISLSTNKCFEWEENLRGNGKWDITAQANQGAPVMERIVDYGVRGLRVYLEGK